MGVHESLFAIARRSGRPQFISQYPEPFLVGESLHPLAGEAALKQPEISWDETMAARSFGAAQLATLVCVLRKVQKMFPRMITVGRTPNTDIAVPDDSVSKMHAFFQRLDSRVFGLTDAGSTNGTFVDDQRLTAHAAPTPVPSGSRVRFGRIGCVIMDAGAFWDSVQK